jgi:hypothetical protein
MECVTEAQSVARPGGVAMRRLAMVLVAALAALLGLALATGAPSARC